jgi:hypothetical protein
VQKWSVEHYKDIANLLVVNVGLGAFAGCIFVTAGVCAAFGVVAVGASFSNNYFIQGVPLEDARNMAIAGIIITGVTAGIGGGLGWASQFAPLGAGEGYAVNGVLGFPGLLCTVSMQC